MESHHQTLGARLMREENHFQNTGAWFADRTGKLTASRMESAMAFLKQSEKDKKEGKAPEEKAERKKLKMEVLAERLTGNIVPKYVTKEMQHGIDTEPLAKVAFTKKTEIEVQDVGFIDHPTIDNCGCSPDGFTSDGGLIEIKCPSTGTHLAWKYENEVPEEHKAQMILQMAVTGKPHVWFVSYDPRLPEKCSLFIKKFVASQEQIAKVEKMAIDFLNEIDVMFEQITLSEE